MPDSILVRPAATVLTIRNATAGFEVLMLRRNLRSDFVGGAYVFPGGGVDAEDHVLIREGRVWGLSDVDASARLSVDVGGLAYYVAAVRELFEEAGLLIARREDGSAIDDHDEEFWRAAREDRRRLNEKSVGFLEMVESRGLLIDASALAYFAHWVTPEGSPRRYDTRFFVARAPRNQVAAHDDAEVVAHQWLRPRDALRAHHQGEFEMILPTIRNLEAVSDFESVDDVMTFARGLGTITRVAPRLVERDGVMVPEIPGEDRAGS